MKFLKKLILSCFLILLLLFLSLCLLISYGLERGVKEYLGIELAYQELNVSWNQLTFKEIVLKKDQKHAKIDQLKASLAVFGLFPKLVVQLKKLDLTLDQINNTNSRNHSFSIEESIKPSWIDIELDQGIIHLVNGSRQLDFDFFLEWKKERLCVDLFFESLDNKLHFESFKKNWQLSLDQVSLYHLKTIVPFLTHKELPFELKSGLIDGSLFWDDQEKLLKGSCLLADIKATSKDRLCKIDLSEGYISLIPSKDQKNRIKFLLDEKACLTLYKEGIPIWILSQISCDLLLEDFENISLDLKANSFKPNHFTKENIQPLSLNFRYNLYSKDLLNLTIKESGQEKEKPALVHLTGIKELNHRLLYHLSLREIGPIEFYLLKNFLKIDEMNSILFQGGRLSLDLDWTMDHREISQLEISYVEGIGLEFERGEIFLEIEELKGQMHTQFSKEGYAFVSSDFQISTGSISSMHTHLKALHFSKLLFGFSLRDSCLEQAMIETELFGAKTSLIFSHDEDRWKFAIEGATKELIPHLPKQLGLSLEQFKESDLLITGHCRREQKEYVVDGSLAIQRDKEQNTLVFGFHIGDQLDYHSLSQGWFHGSLLNLEVILSPFLFPDQKLQLTGLVSLEGSFDDKGLKVFYQGENIALESEDFLIQMDRLDDEGYHTVDFSTFAHKGVIPIEKAIYFDKKYGLSFLHIDCDLQIEQDKIFTKHLKTSLNQLLIEAQLFIDCHKGMLSTVDVEIITHQIYGKTPYVKTLLKQLNLPQFAKIDVEGFIKSDYGRLFFPIRQQGCQPEIYFQGRLEEGILIVRGEECFLDDISLGFVYDHQKELLKLSLDQAKAVINFPQLFAFYELSKGEITFSGFDQSKLDFSLYFNKEALAFVGSGLLQKERLKLSLDQEKTHFFSFYPDKLELELDHFNTLDTFCLSGLVQQTGLEEILDSLGYYQWLKLYRLKEVDFSYSYHQKMGSLMANFKDLEYQKICLGDGSFYVDFTSDTDKILFNQYHLFLEDHASFIGHGLYKDLKFSLATDQFFASLDKLAFEDPLYGLTGQLLGSFHLCLDYEKTVENLQLNLSLDNSKLFLGKYALIPGPISFFWQGKNHPYTLENIRFSLDEKEKNQFQLDKLCYYPRRECWIIDQLNYQIPYKHIDWLIDELIAYFPAINQLEQELKESRKEAVRGYLNGAISKDKKQFYVRLDQGDYFYQTHSYPLNAIELKYQQDLLEISCDYQNLNQIYKAIVKLPINEEESSPISGTLILQDEKAEDPLTVFWEKKESGFSLKHARGEFCGVLCFLDRFFQDIEKQEEETIVGELFIDFEKLFVLLPETIQEKIGKLHLGKGYVFKGLWQRKYHDLVPESFEGSFEGRKFYIQDICLDQFTSHLSCKKDHVYLTTIELIDPAIQAISKPITLKKTDNNQWKFHCDGIIFKEIVPHLLQSKKTFNKSRLVINKLNIDHIEGLLDQKKSWKAQGFLAFTNGSIKQAQHPLFVIPSDILMRLGLDLRLLNPVMGQVEYDIHDEHIWINQFKDVYSAGRASKFYLPKGSFHSSMDFNGNLDLKVRMKQFNLLFKLAEIFTVNVHGSLNEPIFSLQKRELRKKS